MDLVVELIDCMLSVRGNYYIVVQLDEIEFPARNKKTSKFRTEVLPLAVTPKFMRNVFTFQNVSLGSRIQLKIGCFNSKLSEENVPTNILLANSDLCGSSSVLLTQNKITALREKSHIEEPLVLMDSNKQEYGRVTMLLKFKPSTFEQQVDEDVRIVDKIYYNPYENDEEVIKEKLKKITSFLEKKQTQLEEAMKKLDFVRNAHQSVTRDQALLIMQKEKLEKENEEIKKKIEKYTSLKELNIQIDLLKDTPEGREILKEKYAKLLGKLNLERQVYEELSREYFKIEGHIKEKKALDRQIEEVKQASKEQNFHLKRVGDLMPQVKNLREGIKQQEDIIQNLQNIIKENVRNSDLMRDKEIKVNLEKLQYDHRVMTEKQKQIKLALDLNEGELPLNVFQKLQKDEYLRDDPKEVARYKKHAEELLKEVEELTKTLQDAQLREEENERKLEEFNAPQAQFERDILLYQIEALDTKAEVLQKEVLSTTISNAKKLADLKQKDIVLEGLLIGMNYS